MISITGQSLTLEDVERVALGREREIVLSNQAKERITRSRNYVDELLQQNERIYGVTTGFGRLSEVFIQPARRKDLQLNLIRSHASGVGQRLSSPEVRTMMLLRANSLARGDSGCRVEVVERLLDFLRVGIHPVVPEIGSVGASGDLAPLAHVALALVGEGDVEMNGSVIPSRDALARSGLEPIELLAKEGLALINGTQA